MDLVAEKIESVGETHDCNETVRNKQRLAVEQILKIQAHGDNEKLRAKGVGSRAGREMGYGDFCFGRLLGYHRQTPYLLVKKTGQQEWRDDDFQVGSGNARFKEIGSFARMGPFPFFKLPLEIRQIIFGLLLEPFYHNISGIRAALLRIHAKRWGFAEEYEGDFEAHMAREAALEAKFLEGGEKRDFLHQKKPHPGRKDQYEIDGVPRKDNWPHLAGPSKDWLMIDLVRNLSNVSTQFRQELCAVFWASTSISTRFTSGQPLLHFFKERPAVHQSVKSLYLEFDFWEGLKDFDGAALKALCDYLSSILNLQHLDIDITVYDTDLPRLASGKGRYEDLKALRTLKVSKSFEIELRILCDKPFGDDEDARNEHTSELEEKHMPALRDLIMPDTLRQVPSKTEEEKYLRSRPTSLSKTS